MKDFFKFQVEPLCVITATSWTDAQATAGHLMRDCGYYSLRELQ
jgi:hypothetical protein